MTDGWCLFCHLCVSVSFGNTVMTKAAWSSLTGEIYLNIQILCSKNFGPNNHCKNCSDLTNSNWTTLKCYMYFHRMWNIKEKLWNGPLKTTPEFLPANHLRATKHAYSNCTLSKYFVSVAWYFEIPRITMKRNTTIEEFFLGILDVFYIVCFDSLCKNKLHSWTTINQIN